MYATVKEVDPGKLYVVESTLCQAAGKPGYKITFDLTAQNHDDVVAVELDGDFFFDHQSELSGLCCEE